MNRLRRTVFLAAALGVAWSLVIQTAEAKEPLEGTWLLNVAKSTFTAVPGPKSQMRTYSISDGVEKMNSRGLSAEKKPTLVRYEARYDGKDYDISGSAGGDKISLRRIDAFTTESSQKRGGKPVIVATRRVSSDAKVLTVTTTGTLPDGRHLDAVMIFERQ